MAHFDADLAISHGFRYGAAIGPGAITLEDLYTCFPMTVPVASGDAYGKQIAEHMERYLVDNFSPHVYDQEDGRVRSYSSNADMTIDPTAKRGRRLVEFQIGGSHGRVDEATYGCIGVGGPAAPALSTDGPVDARAIAPTLAELLGVAGELDCTFEMASVVIE